MGRKKGEGRVLAAEVGERLRESREAADFAVDALADRLGVSAPAVYAWESGRNEISLEMLIGYSRETGRSIEYLATGHDQSENDIDRLAELLLEVTDATFRGASLPAAIDAYSPRPNSLSPREERALARRSPEFRQFIERRAGRPWAELAEAERLSLARELIRELLE